MSNSGEVVASTSSSLGSTAFGRVAAATFVKRLSSGARGAFHEARTAALYCLIREDELLGLAEELLFSTARVRRSVSYRHRR